MINDELKKNNLIRGIQKLNNIFISYKNDNKVNNENGIENDIKIKDNNSIINNNINTIKRDELVYRMYSDKLKYKFNDDWIIEEKDEEENWENSSFKNDNEQKKENNIHNINNINKYNSAINFENNNGTI